MWLVLSWQFVKKGLKKLIEKDLVNQLLYSNKMGFYWATYICNGKFTDNRNAEVSSKLHIGSVDPMIEAHEWERGYVDKNELINFINSRKKFQIQTEASDTCDFFMMEDCGTTLESGAPGNAKYILVEKNCQYQEKST